MKAKTYSNEQIVDINPACASKDGMQFLKIHHDYKADSAGKPEFPKTGHFYIELEDSISGGKVIKGKNPATAMRPLYRGKIKEEDERLDVSRDISENTGIEILTTKVVALSMEQYSSAMTFVSSVRAGLYIAGIDDCIRFTQSVYNSACLPRHFTEVYTREELVALDTLAARLAYASYGSRDTNISIHDHHTSEEIPLLYHVPAERVIEVHDDGMSQRATGKNHFIILRAGFDSPLNILKALGEGSVHAEGYADISATFGANTVIDELLSSSGRHAEFQERVMRDSLVGIERAKAELRELSIPATGGAGGSGIEPSDMPAELAGILGGFSFPDTTFDASKPPTEEMAFAEQLALDTQRQLAGLFEGMDAASFFASMTGSDHS